MTHKDLKKLIEARIQWINELLGDNYKTTYYSWYGGWNFYKMVDGKEERGAFGFYYRVSTKEFLCYLEGLYNALYYAKYKPEINKAICDNCS